MGCFIGIPCFVGCGCCCWKCTRHSRAVSRLEKKYRRMKIQDLHEEEFIAHLNVFTNLLEDVKDGGARFAFIQGYNENLITLNKVET